MLSMSRKARHQHLCRLDLKRKELLKQKEALLRESKAKLATMETVKAHIDTLMKVGVQPLCLRAI